MMNLNAIELKTFVPSKDFQVSKEFYLALGFTKASDDHGVAYFHHGDCRFLLQNFYEESLADNFMMYLLVEDAEAWHQFITESGLVEQYGVKITELTEQPWGMLDFVLTDPSGVLWRFGQNFA
ncbi:VOC family protein [Marinomonas sp.]|nr:VOC family protein [Marinomonas sp.]MDB4837676.1 VOC family protein [Marinomonas sp.]